MTVTPGISFFLKEGAGKFRGTPLALLGAPASVLPDLTHTLDALLAAGIPVAAVLGPEHGFRGSAQAGAGEGSGTDPATGVPVVDAYSAPMADALPAAVAAGARAVLVDLQHVGVRFYTYESSLYDLIGAARVAGTPVIVCDRPNPVTGAIIGGPVLEPAFASFVGRAPIPVRHGMTIGELATLFARELDAAELVEVIPMAGWRRGAWYEDCGLPWVAPSPNIPTVATAVCYPGTCLFEGTNLSAGRGTTQPFELIGAPWAGPELASRLRAIGLPGVAFRAADFMPQFDRYAGEHVSGVQLHVTDRWQFDPLRTGLEVIAAATELWPGEFEFRSAHFDRLAGNGRLREALGQRVAPAEIVASWSGELAAFGEVRAAHLRYAEA
jgi:uncharacterized protein YbbC (DUF1343 family)